jgi:hypothetical protein
MSGNMELFYTVSSQPGVAQSKPALSLGGFLSSSKVPNGSLGNLFDEMSPYTLQNSRAEYIGLILKNTLKPVASMSLWVKSQEGNICKFRIAPVELTENGEMELVPSVNSKPLYAEFEETSETNKIDLSFEKSFEVGAMLGLWIERTVDMSSDQVVNRNNCQYLYQMFKDGQKWPTQEEVELKIEFEYA